VIDRQKAKARALVARLYRKAETTTDADLRTLIEDAAVMIDEYQAGLTLATPHPLTGYALAHSQVRAQIDPTTNDLEEIAA